MKKEFQIQDVLLYPISLIYGLIIWIRNRLFDYGILKSKEFNINVISVGNLHVGGTGKTPHVEHLIELLKKEFKIASLSRGYKRKTSGFILAKETSTVEEIGDEPKQIKQKHPDVIVAVDVNRVRGINKLLQIEKNLDCVILDDAFQHRYVTPSLSILLVDYNRSIFEDGLLPYGRLREPASERSRADIIIVTKCSKDVKPIELRILEKKLITNPYHRVYFTYTEYENPVPVFKESAKPILTETLKKEDTVVFLLTGIANASQLRKYISEFTSDIRDLDYPDHYAYTAKDMHELIEVFSSELKENKYIITTEKDAMRLQQFPGLEEEIKAAMHYIPVKIDFLENEAKDKDFDLYITQYVRNNKPDNILYKAKNKRKS
jgi:tetraacyldisaccharide 4'-kinase